MGSAAARMGATRLGQLTKRPFVPREKRAAVDDAAHEEMARMAFDTLSVLRGAALKAAQLIAVELDFVPVCYRRELSRSFHQVPPMNRALARKIVKDALGPPEAVFQSFDPVPFAAASLGQVHRAVGPDGVELAVKVQYPGMADSVRADIDLLKMALAPTRYARIFKGCLQEIAERVREELDYRQEARHTMWFAAGEDAARYVFPRVSPHLSTGTVLTTTLVQGLHLDAWVATSPSREARDRYGQLLYDFFDDCVHNGGMIHADPNPGNFLFRTDGRLGIIDFGCVKRLDPELVSAVDCLERQDLCFDALETLHNRLGVHYRRLRDPVGLDDFLSRWAAWHREPHQVEVFDFGESEAYFARGADLIKELYRHIDYYDGAFAYYGRAWHGLLRLLQRLGARVRMQNSNMRRSRDRRRSHGGARSHSSSQEK